MSGFKKAQRKASKAKISIQGGSGSGKTYSALRIATALVARTDPGKRIAVIDTENSAELYSPPFDFDVDDDFGVGNKLSYDSNRLLEKLETARKSGEYGAVVVDSMTHFWKEAGGFTRMIDSICEAQRARGGKADSFAAWKQVDPIYRNVMTYIRQYPLHVILCIRSKQAYERTEEKGKGALKKVGMEPEFREGFEFEMDAQFALDQDHVLVPLKHRLEAHLDGKSFRNPGDDVAECIADWLSAGAPGQSTPKLPEVPPSSPQLPEAPKSEPKVSTQELSLCQILVAKLEAATNPEELKVVALEIKDALKDKKLTPAEYTGKLGPTWHKKNNSFKVAAA